MTRGYYILTTNLSQCLNDVIQSDIFFAIKRKQPDSGPFLDRVLSSADDALDVQFVLFDRVAESDTSWQLVTVYSLVGVEKNEEVSAKRREDHYALRLKKERDLDTPLNFRQGEEVWEALEKTRGKKSTSFFNSARVLLPISAEGFQTIVNFVGPPGEATDQALQKAGLPLLAESELHAYLEQNLEEIEEGLQPYDANSYSEYPTTDGGRIDLFCKDKQGMPVVVELKRGRADDVVVGQLARYIGWAKQNVADGGPVRGVIVANVVSERLKLAALAIPGVKLISYEVRFTLREVD